MTSQALLVAAAIFVSGVLAGWLIRKVLLRLLSKPDARHEGTAGDLIMGGVLPTIVIWSALAGTYGALLTLPLPQRLEEIATRVLTGAAILAGTLAGARIGGGFVALYAARHRRLPGSTSIFANIARVGIFVLGVLVMLQTIGVSVAPLLTALGVGGLAVALALQDTLSNLFAGLHVIVSKKVVPGDYVRLDSGEEGYVLDINWRNTSLTTLRNNVIVVPNARLASAVLTNYYQPGAESAVLVPIGVSYNSDLEKVERATVEVGREVMRDVEGGVPEWEPLIRYHSFEEFRIGLNVVLRVNELTSQYLVTHEFVKRLKERYRREGIEIPFPIRTVISKNGDSAWRQHELVNAGAGE